MKKYLFIDENKRVIGYSDIEQPQTHSYHFQEESTLFQQFIENMQVYRLTGNGELIRCEQLVMEQKRAQKLYELETLRQERDGLFKTYIDRSPFFYNSLSTEEKTELEQWYEAWCDMPERYEAGTWIKPSLPSFLRKEDE